MVEPVMMHDEFDCLNIGDDVNGRFYEVKTA